MTNCNSFVSGAGGSNLGPVKSDTVLSTVLHRCNIFSKEAVFPGRNNAEKLALQTRHTPGPQLGEKKPKQKYCPLKLPSMPTQTSLSLAAVSRWWLVFLKPTENWEKSRRIWRDDVFFFEINRELGGH